MSRNQNDFSYNFENISNNNSNHVSLNIGILLNNHIPSKLQEIKNIFFEFYYKKEKKIKILKMIQTVIINLLMI